MKYKILQKFEQYLNSNFQDYKRIPVTKSEKILKQLYYSDSKGDSYDIYFDVARMDDRIRRE